MTSEPANEGEWVCLTLITPRRIREEVFDYLTGQADLVSGFTASEAAGHGPHVELETMAERVKGNADQVLVRTILGRENAQRLLDRLRAAFPGAELVYWIMPVTDFGVIGEGKR